MERAAELGKLGVRPASSLTAPLAGLGTDRAIPVLPALRHLLPQQCLVRGSTIAIGTGVGATSLLFGLIAEATTRGSWAAVVGLAGLGWAAAADDGVALERVALVPHPGTELLAVTATLLDGFDIVVVSCEGTLAPAIAEQLSARARKAGSVLVSMSAWPNASVTLSTQESQWLTRGRLRCRKLTVSVRGRGSASRPTEKEVWLPDDPPFRATLPEPPARHLKAVS